MARDEDEFAESVYDPQAEREEIKRKASGAFFKAKAAASKAFAYGKQAYEKAQRYGQQARPAVSYAARVYGTSKQSFQKLRSYEKKRYPGGLGFDFARGSGMGFGVSTTLWGDTRKRSKSRRRKMKKRR